MTVSITRHCLNTKNTSLSQPEISDAAGLHSGSQPERGTAPLISIPELETWVETWAFSETIHSRSYTHIIRNIVNDPSVVFDDIVTNEQIQKRAEGISSYYDELIEMTSYWHLLGEGTHTVNGKTVTVSLRELRKNCISA